MVHVPPGLPRFVPVTHPNKHVREAIEYAVSRGWRIVQPGRSSHNWGRLRCPFGARGGCDEPVYSTPRSPKITPTGFAPVSTSALTPPRDETAPVRTFRFVLYPTGNPDLTDNLLDRLFEAGCDDASPGVTCGVTDIPFDREADSLETAIGSAVAAVRSVGLEVDRVEIERRHLPAGHTDGIPLPAAA